MKTFFNRRLVAVAVSIVFLVVLQGIEESLVFNRSLILEGELWRLWTGHLIHENTLHLWMNVTVAILIYLVFLMDIEARKLLFSFVVFLLLLGPSIFWALPQIEWYTGLSASLHTLAAFWGVMLLTPENRLAQFGALAHTLKMLYEMVLLLSGESVTQHGMLVLTETHLLGFALGGVGGVLMRVAGRLPAKGFIRG